MKIYPSNLNHIRYTKPTNEEIQQKYNFPCSITVLNQALSTAEVFYYDGEGNEFPQGRFNIPSDYLFQKALLKTDTAPTIKGLYPLLETGVYTNLGGINATTGNLNLASFDGTTWSKVEVAMPSAKLPLYSAIKSTNIVAGTQFIDDENGNIVYRVKTGQTLLTTDVPANVVGTKVEILSNKAMEIIGDYPMDSIETLIIGDSSYRSSVSSNSTANAYYLQNIIIDKNGVVKKIRVNHATITAGTSFTLCHARKVGSVYQIINTIVKTVTTSNELCEYTVPDWEYLANDYIGIKPNVAGLIKFSNVGGAGVIPIDSSGVKTGNTLDKGVLSLDFSIDVLSLVTITEKIEDLESNITIPFSPRPTNGTVNFQVDINTNFANNTDSNLTKQDSSTILKDWGILLLPTNYDEKGKPIRLIITCHGTGTYINGSATSATLTGADFWLSQGYAVLDMNGLPDGLIGVGTTANVRHYGSPLALQSYIKGYHFAIENYNLYENVFITGTSMGGLSSFMLVQSGSIPIIAQAGFAPCIDLYKQAFSRPWNGSIQRQYIAQLFGFTGTAPTFTTTNPPTTAERDYFMANLDKIVGYDSMLKNVIGANRADVYAVNGSAVTGTTNPTEDAIYDDLYKIHHVPLKIWHNVNDTTVLYRYSKYYVNMVNKAGGLAILRTFPSGGHNAWLNGEIVTDIPTVSGGTTSIEASMYECYLWFKRFDK